MVQVSTFTVAHSITLALTMYGIVSLPAKVVEPMIALSIAYVAIENLVVNYNRHTVSRMKIVQLDKVGLRIEGRLKSWQGVFRRNAGISAVSNYQQP